MSCSKSAVLPTPFIPQITTFPIFPTFDVSIAASVIDLLVIYFNLVAYNIQIPLNQSKFNSFPHFRTISPCTQNKNMFRTVLQRAIFTEDTFATVKMVLLV